ncbi:glycosyltransferase [Chitinophaga oryziterrae]|uniref:Glycosyltransferase n=1 Tax=Chitinophaga oryziterrae TaxID=1031224 RepID=A0A6N8JD59_9BACT|nr:glycosyltransferase [Chitinophaga oryziterrae]MVT43255.1 glycosyltransferase [Chitinophaga oryziterrae]
MMKKKKICFLTTGDITSIATMKRALGMANPLSAMGWDVSVIAMDCAENRQRAGIECGSDIALHYYQPAGAKGEVAQKTQILNTIKPDYIYFCAFGFRNWIRKSALQFKPEMIIEHSELQSGIPDNKGLKKILAHFIEGLSVKYADKLICASKYLEDFYARKAKQLFKRNMPILYSPYAYSTEVIDAPKSYLKELSVKYENNTVLIYMGTMTRNYGLFTMLEAVEMAAKKTPDIKLLLLGRGRHLEEAKTYVKEKNLEQYVEFLGYAPETMLSSYFELADAFISPLNDTVQDWARCPSKIYMYIPFHKPVFTCKIGEPKEIFGDDGYYFDNNQPATLSSLISILAKGELKSVSLDVTEHSWQKRSEDFSNWILQKEQVYA